MKNTRKFLLTILVLALAMQMAFVSQSYAQNKSQNDSAESQRLGRVMNPGTNIEEFRQELNTYFSEMEYVMRLFNESPAVREKLLKNGVMPFETIAQAKVSIANASTEDLRVMRDAYAKFPGWRNAPQVILTTINPQFRQQLESRLKYRQSTGIEPDVPDNCTTAIDAGITNTDISIAAATLITAEAAQEILHTPVNGLAVAATSVAAAAVLTLETFKNIADDCQEETFNNNLVNQINTIPTTIIANDIANTATIIANDNTNKTNILNTIDTAKTMILNNANTNTANANTNTTDIIANDNTNTANIISNDTTNTANIITNDNTNKTQIITNDNTNKTQIITNDNTNTGNIITNDNTNTAKIITNDNKNTAFLDGQITAAKDELRDLILRTQIEADLGEADNASFVALYVTPTAQGGYLDFVQFIVTDTLAKMQASGVNTKNAQNFLNKANADKTSGNYKSAYANYRKAYKAAVN